MKRFFSEYFVFCFFIKFSNFSKFEKSWFWAKSSNNAEKHSRKYSCLIRIVQNNYNLPHLAIFKILVFFQKKNTFSNVSRNLTVSASFYSNFSEFWWKKFHVRKPEQILANIVNALGNSFVQKHQLWAIWVDSFASIVYNIAQSFSIWRHSRVLLAF